MWPKRTLMMAVLALPLGAAAPAQQRGGVLGTGGTLLPEKRLGAATATYFPKTDRITVQAGPLLLHGDTDDGLFVVPNFIVSGHRVVAPGWVDLVFTSYSAKRRYALDRRLAVVADGKSVLVATPRLVLSKAAARGVTEIMSQRMSYAQFQQIARAHDVRLSLGPTPIGLTEGHLAALRDLLRCVELALSFGK